MLAISDSPAQDEGHIKWPSLRAELAMNFVPRRPRGRLFIDGRPDRSMVPCPDASKVGRAFRMVRLSKNFPNRVPSGNCIPFQTRIPGHTFRKQRRPHNVAFNLYMFGDTPKTSHAPTSGRLSRRRHIRFIASSARAGEHLMCSPCEQDCPSREPYVPRRRADEPVKTRRYLILVVPGARLGSVSLASVWKCSVYTFLPSRNIS